MTVTVIEDDGRHRAAVPFESAELPCCAAGHPDAGEAAAHAWRLTRAMAAAMARKTAAVPGG